MPLAYTTHQPLEIPADAYNDDDIATIVVQGARYGGQWMLTAVWFRSNGSSDLIGKIQTVPSTDPDLVVNTAFVWVNDACMTSGVKLAHYENRNNAYGPEEAPYRAAAVFLIDRRTES
ncbi:hypothetical protein GCM10010156_48590 [Planobispora rosea]|uniref:Uncharacterized protein n=1 Tax=Planobispora rosea TaxID=35762 RepID=A0A8J3S3X7_PLARO|nr:hypothetical protein [Planobispora rosea]GGS84271.1 hypothetical protein GCM10010156_48590 [Planobispora rosea]GIH86370.1 hypothetical protein Pro02_47780 [Planobispora rosea]